MKNKIKLIWYPVLVLCMVTTCCTRYDEFKKYMPDGEIVYPQKADLVKTYPGKNRIQLEWQIVDPKVTSCEVFYEQGGIQKSSSVAVHGSGYENDVISVIIPNLDEMTNAFKIFSYDNLGHASIPVEAEETVYGENYERSLLNRTLKSAVCKNGVLQMEWFNAIATGIGVNLEYTDVDGKSRTKKVENGETSTTISDIKVGEFLNYATMYKPVSNAIDTFYAQKVHILIEETPKTEKPVDPSNFKELTLQGNPAFLNSDYSMKTIWDNKFNDPCLITIADGNWPHSVSFDLGYPEGILLTKVRLWQRCYQYPEIAYDSFNIREFEIWGSMDPNPDGSWESWTLLLDEEIIKPSGKPLGENSDEDMQEFYDGHTFTFPSGIPHVRYLRIKSKKSWDGRERVALSEIKLWGMFY